MSIINMGNKDSKSSYVYNHTALLYSEISLNADRSIGLIGTRNGIIKYDMKSNTVIGNYTENTETLYIGGVDGMLTSWDIETKSKIKELAYNFKINFIKRRDDYELLIGQYRSSTFEIIVAKSRYDYSDIKDCISAFYFVVGKLCNHS